MSCRHRYTLLPILLSVFAPLGCTRWQCGFPQMMMPTHLIGTANNAPAPAGNVSGEIDAGQSAQLCLEAGTALEKKGYITEAIQQYENARAQDAQAKVARRLAVLYDKQGDAQRAEAEYLRALQEQSGDAELLNDFGYFHLRHDHLQVAENWLRNATTINPNLQCAWINLGQVLARQGRIEESYQAFAHVLRPAEAYSNLGVLLAKQGRTVEARSALQQAISLDPSLEQPQAFLKALPPTPALLPPGITKNNAPPAPPPAKSAPAMLTSTKPTTTAKTETPRSTSKVQPEPTNIAASAMKVSTAPATKPALKPEPAVLPVSAAQKQTPSVSDSTKTTSRKDSGSAEEPIILHGPVRPLPVIITKKQPAKASDDLPTIINKRTSASEASSPAFASPPSGESTHKQTKETSTTTPRMLPAPPLPPPPPPPAPTVSRSLSSAIRESDAPIVRTAAWSVAQSEQKTSSVPSLKPLPLVLPTPPPVKMLPVANTKPAPSRKPAPQATLTDCYGEIEIEETPQK